ncbi:uncharacterized protein LOC112043390 isoform X1 [Bicyclus anynana]|uniref:Uncharacterized protein LOC112043390 isoform X1 n=1 Tax=Bicyclus anynana TaxID=110368 RepID=A0A6J1MNS5_BICAN|nr:uncharacterized protein LOC112043390 isoform X1 [Bicyclus anynana]
MKYSHFFGGFLVLLAVLIDIVQPLCVLESDFGFKINCAFKKSGLFRVRNLGGVKAHASIGFSLGDELGFEQSLTNQDPSRRRSVSFKNGAPNVLVDTAGRPAGKQEKRAKQNRIMMRPMPPPSRPNQAAMDKLSTLHRRVSSTTQPVAPGPTVDSPFKQPIITMAKPMPMGVPPFKPLPPKEDTLKVVPLASSKKYSPLQIPQSKGPAIAYQSENYNLSPDSISKMVSHMTAVQYQPANTQTRTTMRTTVNPFLPMPPSSQAISIIPAPVLKETLPHTHVSYNTVSVPKTGPLSNFIDPVPHQVHDLANNYPAYNTKKVDDYNSITGYSDDVTLKFNKEDINAKIAEIAKAGNISMEAVEAAIALRQQQLLSKYANIPMPATTTTTTTTTEQPLEVYQLEPEPEIIVAPIPQKPKRNPTSGKVMNAPREYYPVGYEKNFDDHFQSKVDLPDTNFHCGDQKYFPGLYGDENLGCMVFHVCALTDDGLVMKSFLCPESTLFDQTILKCNWWFYVDCKNTVKLYDTNIPVSKSYQLMKALTFFSSYKKEMEEGQSMEPENVEGIKEAITILENQDSKPAASDDMQIVTPLPVIDERHSNKKDYSNLTSPVYRGTREYTNSTERRNVRRPVKPQEAEDIKLVTVNAGLHFNITKDNTANNTDTSINNSTERKRRRIASRNKNFNSRTTTTTTTSTTTTTTQKPEEVTTSLKELLKQEIQPMEVSTTTADVKQEKLTDAIDNLEQIDASILKEAEISPAVRRFYRSSAELNNADDKEITIVNNEKIQIVRPTPVSQLVGEYPTQIAAVAKLDEAVLGKYSPRFKKEVIAIVTPSKHEIFLNPSRDRT